MRRILIAIGLVLLWLIFAEAMHKRHRRHWGGRETMNE